MKERYQNNLKKNKYHVPVQIIIPKYTKRTIKRKNLDNPLLLESPKSKEFQPPDLEIDFLIDSGAESISLIFKLGRKSKLYTRN